MLINNNNISTMETEMAVHAHNRYNILLGSGPSLLLELEDPFLRVFNSVGRISECPDSLTWFPRPTDVPSFPSHSEEDLDHIKHRPLAEILCNLSHKTHENEPSMTSCACFFKGDKNIKATYKGIRA